MGNCISTAEHRELESAESKNLQLESDLTAARNGLLNAQSNERESQILIAKLRTQLDESSTRYASLEEANQRTVLELELRATQIEGEKKAHETTIQARDRAISKANNLQGEAEKLIARTQSLEQIVQSTAKDLLETQDAKAKLSIEKASVDDKATQLSVSLNQMRQSNCMLQVEGKLAAEQSVRKLADQASAAATHLAGEMATANARLKSLEKQLQEKCTDNSTIQRRLTQCQAELAVSRQHMIVQAHNMNGASSYKDMDFSSHVRFSRSEKHVRIRADWWQDEMRIDIREFYGTGSFTKKVS